MVESGETTLSSPNWNQDMLTSPSSLALFKLLSEIYVSPEVFVFQCFSRALDNKSFIDFSMVRGSSTSPAETIELAKSCSATSRASWGSEVRRSLSFLMSGWEGLISNWGWRMVNLQQKIKIF